MQTKQQCWSHTIPSVLTSADRGLYLGATWGPGHLWGPQPDLDLELELSQSQSCNHSCSLGLGLSLDFGLWPTEAGTLGNAGTIMLPKLGLFSVGKLIGLAAVNP